jgi:nitrate reductase beta subunit
MLYDADRVQEAASVANDKDLYQAQCDIFLDPFDESVQEAARKEGIPDAWLKSAQESPVYKMAMDWKVALPLHPEYRTLPMVWYVPPLSPIQNAVAANKVPMNGVFPDLKSLRIPMKYLANMLTAGDEAPVEKALERMMAMRIFKRSQQVDGELNLEALNQVGLTEAQVEEMYRYMALANYEDRFVIPTSHKAYAEDAYDMKSGCGFTFGNGCSGGDSEADLFGGKKQTVRQVIPVEVRD